MLETVGQWMLGTIGAGLAVGTAVASFSSSPHWAVRMWDFPRVQIALIAFAVGTAYALLFYRGSWMDMVLLASVAVTMAWQTWKVMPYTPIAPKRVERADGTGTARLRLLITNVRMENEEHQRVLDAIQRADPDVVLAVETDERWTRALEPLARTYPHNVRCPQDNWYGLVLLSRLPLHDARIEHLVQDDIPSVHADIELEDGTLVQLHGLHPRPPEPIRDQHSTPRDAELVVLARRIKEAGDVPTVVAGDLNDVAWSPTSELFLRLSGLMDPRHGRGLYSSFDADKPLLRYPLDHVFHSSHFRLCELRRLDHVGSDHFPMLVELEFHPAAPATQEEPEPKPGDEEEATEKIEEQREAAATGEDRPSRE
jgi:endonuclease/exonuclease/phosphatase (EEP) superfamily protein YafD